MSEEVHTYNPKKTEEPVEEKPVKKTGKKGKR